MSDASVKCLLVHGMTASPKQMGPIQAALEANGYSVVAPLLSGHGTKVEDLIGLRWEDWYADILRTVTSFRSTKHEVRSIFYVGMSFGALLGLKLAIDRPDLVKGLVCIGTPLTLFPWARALYHAINYTPLRLVIRTWPKKFELAVADPVGREIYRQSSYAQFPLPVVREIRRLQATVRRDLHRITNPVLMMHARKDLTAPPEAMEIVSRSVKHSVEQVWLERSYHVATLDYDKELISAKAVDFLRSLVR